ncbi:unnamed protein product [Prunus brigantina]
MSMNRKEKSVVNSMSSHFLTWMVFEISSDKVFFQCGTHLELLSLRLFSGPLAV